MAYVRWLKSERTDGEWVIRRYEVETPEWHYEWDLPVVFPKLVDLELRIFSECAHYFRKGPYSLAETIWVVGLKPACFRPFCCTWWDYEVLYHPREPVVDAITDIDHWRQGPVILQVTLQASRDNG
jgi:hypothetical protein